MLAFIEMADVTQPGSQGPQGQSAGTQTLGGFEIVKKLGQGGMGAVFLARQLSVDRPVALKVLPPRLAKNAQFVARFLREARAAAQLSHVNIVQAINAGQAGGYYYFAMEFVDGRNLRELLEWDGRLPEERALGITLQIARALDYAHSTANIIHRDIKPENILLTPAGVPKLTDLGLARQVETGDSSLTKTGVAIGTPGYISPEQVRGETDLDGRTDVYSLGATLYHLLTGQMPYAGGTPAVIMARHLTDPVPDPRAADPHISPAAAAIVRRAMAKDRAGRYPTAGAMADDLQRALKSRARPVGAALAHPPAAAGARAPGRPGARRRRTLWPYVAAAAAVALVAIVWAAFPSRTDRRRGHLTVAEVEEPEPDDIPPVEEGRDAPESPRRRDPAPRPPPTRKPDPPRPRPDPETVRRRAADKALQQLEAFGRKHVDEGKNYDAAIALFTELPPEYKDLLAGRAASQVKRLRAEAEGKMAGPITEAERLLGQEKPAASELRKAAGALKPITEIAYTPLTEQANSLHGQLTARLEQLDAQMAAAAKQTMKDQLLARNAELCKAYLERCEELKEQERGRVKAKYEGEWAQLGEEIKRATAQVDRDRRALRDVKRLQDEAKKRRDELYKRIPRPFRDHHKSRFIGEHYEERERAAKEELSRHQKELLVLLKRKEKIADAVKSLHRKIALRKTKREGQVRGVCDQHRGALAKGGEIPEAKMKANYEAALELK